MQIEEFKIIYTSIYIFISIYIDNMTLILMYVYVFSQMILRCKYESCSLISRNVPQFSLIRTTKKYIMYINDCR